MEVLASSLKAFRVVLVLGACDFLKSRSVHDVLLVVSSFALLSWCLFLCFFGGWGGGFGKRGTWWLCTLVGQAPCFSTGSILTKWEVHCCCCFEAQHQTRDLTSHGGNPNPQVKLGFSRSFKPAHQWIWTLNLYWSQGGPKMDYTKEPSPLRNPINIIFGSWILP